MKLTATFIIFFTAALSFNATASIVVGGTRVVFDGTHQAVSLSVENKDKVTNLVQSWVTPADNSALTKDSMIITPPLFRLEAGKKASIRIVRSGMPVPEDRESMLWLNVKGIPAMEDMPDKNTMQIAINSKLKLIYRPTALKGQSSEDNAKKVSWEFKDAGLQVKNPTPFYINFSAIEVNHRRLTAQYYVAPFSTLNITEGKIPAHGSITWSLINDFGMKGKDKVIAY